MPIFWLKKYPIVMIQNNKFIYIIEKDRNQSTPLPNPTLPSSSPPQSTPPTSLQASHPSPHRSATSAPQTAGNSRDTRRSAPPSYLDSPHTTNCSTTPYRQATSIQTCVRPRKHSSSPTPTPLPTWRGSSRPNLDARTKPRSRPPHSAHWESRAHTSCAGSWCAGCWRACSVRTAARGRSP